MDKIKPSDVRVFMESEVEMLIASGKTMREFCKDKPYAVHKLIYWKNKVLNGRNKSGDSSSSFVALRPSSVMGSQAVKVEIICPNGLQINIFDPVSASFIKSLL